MADVWQDNQFSIIKVLVLLTFFNTFTIQIIQNLHKTDTFMIPTLENISNTNTFMIQGLKKHK